jgi:hypothetical protein
MSFFSVFFFLVVCLAFVYVPYVSYVVSFQSDLGKPFFNVVIECSQELTDLTLENI